MRIITLLVTVHKEFLEVESCELMDLMTDGETVTYSKLRGKSHQDFLQHKIPNDRIIIKECNH